MRPMHTGIIANDWIDFSSPLDDKEIYCVEDESVPGSTHDKYTVSPDHLMVPTLGERMKAADPATRVVSVAGKDRSAVLMGGHKVDEMWWRSEEHTTELQSPMRTSYAVFCLEKKTNNKLDNTN